MPLIFLFIVVPIIEIAVLIEVGGMLGVPTTLFLILVTAIVGVNMLRQQGLKSWSSIQTSLAQGQLPALEMASGVQLLFAGALLLTPGFVTDAIGFSLMIPQVRDLIAGYLIKRWVNLSHSVSHSHSSYQNQSSYHDDAADQTDDFSKGHHKPFQPSRNNPGRVIDGEYEDESK